MEIEEEIPAWVTALIHAKFSKSAKKNKDDHLKYCCVDCRSKAFTEKERQTDHQDHHVHHVLEAFSVSRHYGYEIGAIKRLKDKKGYDLFTGVASYKSNAILVYIQKSRAGPYPYGQYKDKCKGDGNACVTCGWLLKDKRGRYCSIVCKLLDEARARKPRFDALVRSLKEHQVGDVWPKKKVAQKKKEEINGTGESANGGEIMEQNTVHGGKISLLKRMDMEEQKRLNDKAKKASKKRKRSPAGSLEINNSNLAADQNSDEKLESLNYVLTNRPTLRGLRTKRRKGIPFRAPTH